MHDLWRDPRSAGEVLDEWRDDLQLANAAIRVGNLKEKEKKREKVRHLSLGIY